MQMKNMYNLYQEPISAAKRRLWAPVYTNYQSMWKEGFTLRGLGKFLHSTCSRIQQPVYCICLGKLYSNAPGRLAPATIATEPTVDEGGRRLARCYRGSGRDGGDVTAH